MLVIVNPNNPDGRLTRRADLIAMARERSAAGRWLVVDESFIECAPGDSVKLPVLGVIQLPSLMTVVSSMRKSTASSMLLAKVQVTLVSPRFQMLPE